MPEPQTRASKYVIIRIIVPVVAAALVLTGYLQVNNILRRGTKKKILIQVMNLSNIFHYFYTLWEVSTNMTLRKKEQGRLVFVTTI